MQNGLYNLDQTYACISEQTSPPTTASRPFYEVVSSPSPASSTSSQSTEPYTSPSTSTTTTTTTTPTATTTTPSTTSGPSTSSITTTITTTSTDKSTSTSTQTSTTPTETTLTSTPSTATEIRTSSTTSALPSPSTTYQTEATTVLQRTRFPSRGNEIDSKGSTFYGVDRNLVELVIDKFTLATTISAPRRTQPAGEDQTLTGASLPGPPGWDITVDPGTGSTHSPSTTELPSTNTPTKASKDVTRLEPTDKLGKQFNSIPFLNLSLCGFKRCYSILGQEDNEKISSIQNQ